MGYLKHQGDSGVIEGREFGRTKDIDALQRIKI
jgi:hypothetical protein